MSTYWVEVNGMQGFGVESLKKINHLEDLDVDGKIVE
jgi:hypothetical protein